MIRHKFEFAGMRLVTKIALVLGGRVMAVGLALLFGFVVRWLWNWLMPEIFGLPEIRYWQAWGLVLLAHIFFKAGHDSWNPHKRDEHWKRSVRERFARPEAHRHGEDTEGEKGSPAGETV